jgi:hypothetical protein
MQEPLESITELVLDNERPYHLFYLLIVLLSDAHIKMISNSIIISPRGNILVRVKLLVKNEHFTLAMNTAVEWVFADLVLGKVNYVSHSSVFLRVHLMVLGEFHHDGLLDTLCFLFQVKTAEYFTKLALPKLFCDLPSFLDHKTISFVNDWNISNDMFE